MADIQITAGIDTTQLITGMQELASSVEQNSSKIESSLSEIGAISEKASASLSENFQIARGAVEGAINPLVTAQQNYAATSGLVADAETRLVAAHSQDEAALELLAQAEASAATSGKDLVVVNQLLIETGTEVARAIQELGGALELNAEAESALTAARENAIQAAQQLIGVQAQIISQAEEFTGVTGGQAASTQQAANATSELASASENAVGPTATLAELQQILATASERLATATAELKAAEAGLDPGAVIAAFQEQAIAIEQVEAAQNSYQSKVNSLQASLAEQKAILADANVSWIEYATAEQAAASISNELQAGISAQAESISGVVVGAEAAATAQTQVNVVSAQLTATLNSLASILQTVGASSSNTASVFQFLGNAAAVAQSTQQQFAQAVQQANGVLAQYNLQLQGTAGNLQLVTKAAQGAAGAVQGVGNPTSNAAGQLSALGGIMAYVGGRASALALGLGQLGFALGTLGRASSALAPIFQGLFVVAVPILLIEAVSTLIEKFDALQEKIRKTATEFDDLASTQIQAAQSTELTNLKLEDQINKFEGRPTANRLKEAILESAKAAEQLNKSLEDAIEKTLELLKAGNVSLWDSFITGQSSTSGIRDALKEPLEALKDAKREQDLARLSDNKSAQEAADKNVETATKEAERILGIEDQKNRDAQAIRKKQLEASAGTVTGGQFQPPIELPGLSQAEAAKKVTEEFRAANAEIREGQVLLKESVVRTEELQKGAELLRQTKLNEDTEEALTTKKITTEPDIRAAEENARLEGQAGKKAADDAFRDVEATLKKQVAAEENAGVEKAQAVLNSIPAYQAALRARTSALLESLGQEHDLMVDALTAQRNLDLQGPRTPSRIAAVKADTEALLAEDTKYETERQTIINNGSTAISNSEAESDQKTFEARIAGYKKVVDQERETVRTTIEVAKEQASQEETVIKGSTENQLRLVQTQEQLHLVTSQQALESRLGLLQAEQTAIGAAAAEQVTTLTAQRDQVSNLWQSLSAGGATEQVLKPVITMYEQLTLAISKAGAAQDQLNQKIDNTKIDAAIQSWKDYEKTVTQFVDQSTSAFNGFIQNIFTGNRTLAEDFRQLFRSILQDFIKMILSMIEQTALFQEIETKVKDTLSNIFKIPPQPVGTLTQGIPLGGAVPGNAPSTVAAIGSTLARGAGQGGAAAPLEGGGIAGADKVGENAAILAQINAQWIAHNAQLVGLYTQDSTAYSTSQATKVGVTSSTQSAQTSAATAGETARTSVEQRGVTQWTIQNAIKRASSVLFHAQDVADSTAAGVSKDIANKVSQAKIVAQQAASTLAIDASYARSTIAYAASEAGKTAAATAGEAARKAEAIAGQAAVAGAAIGAAIAITSANTVRAESDVFLQAIESIPFPENLVAAPAAAATVKAEMAGFVVSGAAAKGALLETDMPIFAHAKEMILPASISTGLQSVISTGSVGGGSDSQETNVHVHMGDVTAMDTAGAASVYRRTQKELGKYVQRAIKSGHINLARRNA